MPAIRLRGLTLVELMVALAVLALLAGVAVPYVLASLPGYRASGAARQVVADLRLARTLAVERGVRAFVVFDPATSTYAVRLDTDGVPGLSAGDEEVKRVALGSTYRNVRIGSARARDPVTFPDDVALFKPRGTSNGGSVYLTVSGRGDVERKITVMSTTGRVRAYVWNPSSGEWE